MSCVVGCFVTLLRFGLSKPLVFSKLKRKEEKSLHFSAIMMGASQGSSPELS